MLSAIQGLMGAGKSYMAVNWLLPRYLLGTGRHVYTNLPIDGAEGERLICSLARNPIKQAELRARIHFLPKAVGEVGTVTDEDTGLTAGEHDRLSEFWFFVEPNSVVILDEAADIWPAKEQRTNAPTLLSFINHSRHYKIDLYVFTQHVDDLDPRVRRKIHHTYLVANSVWENMFEHTFFKGMRWPIQFFMVKQYLGPDVIGMSWRAAKKVATLNSWHIWPRAKGFRHYRSFSEAGKLPGMRRAREDSESEDLKSVGARVGMMAEGFWRLTMYGAMAVVGAYMGWRFLYGLLHAGDNHAVDQGLASAFDLTNGPPSEGGAGGRAARAGRIAQTNQEVSVVIPGAAPVLASAVNPGVVGQQKKEVIEPELIRFVTSGYAKTTRGRRIGVGSVVGGITVQRLSIGGVESSEGRQVSWDDLLGRTEFACSGSGRGDQRAVGGFGSGVRGPGGASGDGSVAGGQFRGERSVSGVSPGDGSPPGKRDLVYRGAAASPLGKLPERGFDIFRGE